MQTLIDTFSIYDSILCRSKYNWFCSPYDKCDDIKNKPLFANSFDSNSSDNNSPNKYDPSFAKFAKKQYDDFKKAVESLNWKIDDKIVINNGTYYVNEIVIMVNDSNIVFDMNNIFDKLLTNNSNKCKKMYCILRELNNEYHLTMSMNNNISSITNGLFTKLINKLKEHGVKIYFPDDEKNKSEYCKIKFINDGNDDGYLDDE